MLWWTLSLTLVAWTSLTPTHTPPPMMSLHDPFRPPNPPIEPMLINALTDMFAKQQQQSVDADAAQDALERMLESRAADPDYKLTPDEIASATSRILAIGAAAEPLWALVQAAVDAAPWVAKYGALSQFGVGDLGDPYVRMSRAECMLAAHILHIENESVSFLEEERLEVLSVAPVERVAEVRSAIEK